MRVALYARVSTTDQDAELQLVELRRYAAARGWVIAAEFVDRGVSGMATSRPALDQLWAAAGRRDVGGAVVWRFDRFSRSVSDLVRSVEEFRALGVAFVSSEGTGCLVAGAACGGLEPPLEFRSTPRSSRLLRAQIAAGRRGP